MDKELEEILFLREHHLEVHGVVEKAAVLIPQKSQKLTDK